MLRLRFLALLLLPVALPAQSRWVTLTPPNVHPELRIDTSTVQRVAGGATAWIKKESVPTDTTAEGKHYAYTMTRFAVRCDDHLLALAAGIFYNSKGNPISSYTVPTSQWEYEAPPPESLGEFYLASICNLTSSKKPSN